jgi:nucleoside-diphosphate-sugar epimerase
MAHVLITGIGGYIGSTLAELLLARGHRVTGIDRFFFGQRLVSDLLGHPQFTAVRKDIRDVECSDFTQVDCVCDMAALSNDPTGEMDPELTHAVNHHGRVHVAQTARQAGVRRYVLASSCSVYGHAKSTNLDETSDVNPVSTYAKANLEAERGVLPLASPDFTVTVLRQATVFGLSRRMRFDLVINLMTLNAVQKGKIFILGGGKQWRPIVHVRDTARAFTDLLSAPVERVNGEIFNVGAMNAQILSLAYVVRENLPFRVEMEVVPDDADKRDYNVSFEKLTRTIGFRAELTPAEGVQEIYDALKNGRIAADPTAFTVDWYRRILEARALVDQVSLNGRLI